MLGLWFWPFISWQLFQLTISLTLHQGSHMSHTQFTVLASFNTTRLHTKPSPLVYDISDLSRQTMQSYYLSDFGTFLGTASLRFEDTFFSLLFDSWISMWICISGSYKDCIWLKLHEYRYICTGCSRTNYKLTNIQGKMKCGIYIFLNWNVYFLHTEYFDKFKPCNCFSSEILFNISLSLAISKSNSTLVITFVTSCI